MYRIMKCSEVSDSQIFKAFTDGFSDYMIQVKMDEASFIDRFFGPEGNDRKLSYIAFREDKAVGVILGGIKIGENFKTLRCGGMAVIPMERGTGLAKRLMKLHEKAAIEIGCRQLFLEVINGNDRAIKFYKKMGYEKVYDLTYRTWELEGKNPLKMDKNSLQNKIELLTYDDIHALRKIDYSHLPWQGEFPYFKLVPCHFYGIKDNEKIVAGVAATSNRVFYLWVHPEKRNKGYAKALLNKVIIDLKPDALRITYSNNSQIHTFANHYKMTSEPISQLEMYKWLE
ncbi:GNAT family N-acetyltransferase [Maledivibacter halophilus]|uniref:Acetyltransferase (GNAT) domain-containing protein n=1 Tax=Maledivibacter halophilus TaxID=36842 RepID=A0A1T5KRF7_9FIRM|nr:GNAT family N-acetyltransferase [Maledivibacter halophilus]SKC65999.1 Acetyltransferase (GNAT) domain-containing protein [Maledivibacter halophilus]